MTTYRMHHRERGDQTVQATRVVTDGHRVCFENHADGRWQSPMSAEATDVLRLRRRVHEPDGAWQWIRTLPDPVARPHVHF